MRMNILVEHSLILAASAIITGALLHAAEAGAADYVHHGVHGCKAADNATAFKFQDHQLLNSSTIDLSAYYCPITDSDTTPVQDLKELKAYVSDGSSVSGSAGQVKAYACIAYPLTSGGICGTGAGTSSAGTGYQALNVPVDGLVLSAGDMPYLWVRLPKITGGVPSRLSGFTTKYWH
jgi:hypothetical protein